MNREEYLEYLKNDPNRIKTICKKCKRQYTSDPSHIGKCPICRIDLSPLVPLTPKCPTCGSSIISKVSQTRRSLNAWAFGINNPTARAQFECKNCGYKW